MDELKRYEYQYIVMQEIDNGELKTKKFEVRSKTSDVLLGVIKWHGAWRQYCFFPEGETVFSVGCMECLNFFLTNLGHERRG